MKYYKVVKPDMHDYFTGYTTVKDELLTSREKNRKFPHLFDDCFTEVEVSQKKIYWFFGARFEVK